MEILAIGTIHIFEGDKDIIRMAAMNAVLHGFDQSPIVRRDSICGGEDKWDEVQFDVILENPPFSGQRGDAKRSLRIEKGDKYVLFLAAAIRSLRPGGRAGIVLPNGILFGDTNSHLEVKKRLLADCDLQAVVTLPAACSRLTRLTRRVSSFPEDRQAHEGNMVLPRARRRLIAQNVTEVRPTIPQRLSRPA